jgi:signal transduction histidine kinase
MSAAPFYEVDGEISGAVVALDDVSAQKTAERALHDSLTQMRALSARLMRTQDDERRRIAQMLHETTAQDLAGLKMLLSRLSRTSASLSDADRSVLKESVELSDRVMTDVRTLSYLLHPPFLDEAGLLSALRWYAEGFTRRSGIVVELDVPPTLARLARDVETALFRVIQEALLNIHRHAGSTTATVRLRATPASLSLEIEDRGRGMSEDVVAGLRTGAGAVGVGLPGMRQRLEQLGGRLEVESSKRGTRIRAVLPVSATAP